MISKTYEKSDSMLTFKIGNQEEVVIKMQERNSEYATTYYDFVVKKNDVVVCEGVAESSAWGNEQDAIVREIDFFDLGKKSKFVFPKVNEKDVKLLNNFLIEEHEGIIIVKTIEEGKNIEYHIGENVEYFKVDDSIYPSMQRERFFELKGLLSHMSHLAYRRYSFSKKAN